MNREALQQQGADYRVAAGAFNQGAMAALTFHLDAKEKQMLRASEALNLAANAQLNHRLSMVSLTAIKPDVENGRTTAWLVRG